MKTFFKFIDFLSSPGNQTAHVAISSVWTLGKYLSKAFDLEESPF